MGSKKKTEKQTARSWHQEQVVCVFFSSQSELVPVSANGRSEHQKLNRTAIFQLPIGSGFDFQHHSR